MGIVEDVRQVTQDLVVPDLKALQERVSGLEQYVRTRFDDMMDRINRMENNNERRHAELVNFLSLDARIRKIEQTQTTASEARQG